MEALALAVATALVTAMTTDGWEKARSAVVKLWRRHRPDHVPAIEADIDATHAEVVAGGTGADEELVADWKRKLRRLLDSDPALEAELRRVLDDELMPLLPAAEQARVQNIQQITASAAGAVAQGVMYGNIINHGTPGAAGPGAAGPGAGGPSAKGSAPA